jgi:hypothetical protein
MYIYTRIDVLMSASTLAQCPTTMQMLYSKFCQWARIMVIDILSMSEHHMAFLRLTRSPDVDHVDFY